MLYGKSQGIVAGLTVTAAILMALSACVAPDKTNAGRPKHKRVPVIDVTDLYHPPQDVGDNFDLITPYALAEVDLKAVVIDVTDQFRRSETIMAGSTDPKGPREPGIVPITQLNCIFDRAIPYGIGPFHRMRSVDDRMLNAPPLQQTGIELILKTLRESPEKVEILSFGSARTIAAAYNREPALMLRKVKIIRLSAGASGGNFLEWNVLLDPKAIVCLLRSDLPIAIYPCATDKGPFEYGPNNTYWKLANLKFVQDMNPRLRNYLSFAFERSARVDFLAAMDEPNSSFSFVDLQHNVWETALWLDTADRLLVKRPDGHYRIIPREQIQQTDAIVRSRLLPVTVTVRDDGAYSFVQTEKKTNFRIYERSDPSEYEAALREALPALYLSFLSDGYVVLTR